MSSDQPVKVSRIELIENKLSANVKETTESDTPTKVVERKPTEQQTQSEQKTPIKTTVTPATPSKPTATKDSTKEKNEKTDIKQDNLDDSETSIVTADYIQQSMFIKID